MIICSVLFVTIIISIGTLICTSDDSDYAVSALAQMNSASKRLAK